MGNVQNCDSYITIPSSETSRSFLQNTLLLVLEEIIAPIAIAICYISEVRQHDERMV
jgi:hypothetical protein